MKNYSPEVFEQDVHDSDIQGVDFLVFQNENKVNLKMLLKFD